ncbi:MAG: hypothetical protein ACU0CA_03945 [Paracoccaceae bacterium]
MRTLKKMEPLRLRGNTDTLNGLLKATRFLDRHNDTDDIDHARMALIMVATDLSAQLRDDIERAETTQRR